MRDVFLSLSVHVNRYAINGTLLCAGLALLSWVIAVPVGAQSVGMGLLPLSMFMGMLLVYLNPTVISPDNAGVRLCRTTVLRTGLALYGFQIGIADVVDLGLKTLAATVLLVTTTLLVANWVGRMLGLPLRLRMLVGMGSAICGAAAIAATTAGWKGQNAETAAALATAMVFGMLGIPVLCAYASLSGFNFQQSGLLFGLTIHEMGHVLAAAGIAGAGTIDIAVVEKMLRVSLLAPALICVLRFADVGEAQASSGPRIPYFISAFVIAVILNSTGVIPQQLVAGFQALGQAAMAFGMVALGLNTRWCDIRCAGLRVWLLGACLCLFVWALGIGLIHGLQLGAPPAVAAHQSSSCICAEKVSPHATSQLKGVFGTVAVQHSCFEAGTPVASYNLS